MHEVSRERRLTAAGCGWRPTRSAEDGLFDVLLIGDVTKLDFVRRSRRSTAAAPLAPEDRAASGANVRVESADAAPVVLDGEQPGTTPAEFQLLPRALRVKVADSG